MSRDIIMLSVPTVATEKSRINFMSVLRDALRQAGGTLCAIAIDEVHHLGLSREYEGSWHKLITDLRRLNRGMFEIGFTATRKNSKRATRPETKLYRERS